MSRVLLIAGTWGTRHDGWWRADSPFAQALEAHGHQLAEPGDGSSWTTELDGVLGQHGAWVQAGAELARYLLAHAVDVVIAHSHGGQVAAYAAAAGGPIPRLITLATPVRGDMEAIYRRARPQLGRWTHVYAVGGQDRWQLLGSLFDGVLRVWRAMPEADCNVVVRGIDHVGLHDAALWTARGWWRWLDP